MRRSCEEAEQLAQARARQLQFGQTHGFGSTAVTGTANLEARVRDLRSEVVELSNNNRKLRQQQQVTTSAAANPQSDQTAWLEDRARMSAVEEQAEELRQRLRLEESRRNRETLDSAATQRDLERLEASERNLKKEILAARATSRMQS